MARCAFIKPGGERCGSTVMKGYDTCYGHRPDLADERRRNASKGGSKAGRGRARLSSEIPAIKSRILTLADEVLEGERDKGAAAVAGQLFNTVLRAIEAERRLKETEDLERRLDALEKRQETNGGSKSWAR